MRLDDAGERVGGDAEGGRASHQPIDIVCELGEGRCRGRDDRSPAASKIHEALVAQPLVGVQDGVLVDVQRFGDIACRGKAVTGGEDPGEDVGANGGRHLVVKSAGAVGIDTDEHPTLLSWNRYLFYANYNNCANPPDIFVALGSFLHTGGMRITPRRLAIGMSLWIPNLFSGIRIRRFSEDWTHATVELHVNVFTRNYVKTAFGGSMSAMTDPYFFMLVMHQLGRDHVVWDTRGEIEFLKPGRGVLTAEFEVSKEKAEEIRERARGGAKVLEWFETVITDREGDVVAKVRREVYIREKKRVTASLG